MYAVMSSGVLQGINKPARCGARRGGARRIRGLMHEEAQPTVPAPPAPPPLSAEEQARLAAHRAATQARLFERRSAALLIAERRAAAEAARWAEKAATAREARAVAAAEAARWAEAAATARETMAAAEAAARLR